MAELRVRVRPEPLPLFATFERGRGLVELRCRVTGEVIGKTMPVGQQRVRRTRKATFVETDMQFTYLANYREVEIDMADADGKGSTGKHVGGVSIAGAEQLRADPVMLARFTETDLAQWRSEGATITERMDRRPKRVLRVADFIRD